MNKRLFLSRGLVACGVHHLLFRRQEPRLLVINYHRLWPRASNARTDFDDGVFGPDQDTFRRQIEWLKSVTVVLDEDSLLRMSAADSWPPGTILSADYL